MEEDVNDVEMSKQAILQKMMTERLQAYSLSVLHPIRQPSYVCTRKQSDRQASKQARNTTTHTHTLSLSLSLSVSLSPLSHVSPFYLSTLTRQPSST